MMNNDFIRKLIIRGEKDKEALLDAFDMVRALELEGSYSVDGKVIYDEVNFNQAHNFVKTIRKFAVQGMQKYGSEECVDLYRSSLLFDAPFNFDCFCRFIEFNREPKAKFYEPRRKQLYQVADALQQLEERKVNLLAISLPPGTGKSTIAIFYLCWTSGRHPELQSIGASHNDEFLRGVYDECLRIFDQSGEYLYHEVFPKSFVSSTNAKDLRIDLQTRKRFQTLQFSSVKSSNAGKIRATNLLYCDDLVEGIEQAMSRDRLDALNAKYTVDLKQRKQGDYAAELHIATRWSNHDIIGRLEDLHVGDDKALFLNVPAINEDGESNFDYPYGLGYSIEALKDLKESMDEVSFNALYMGQPVEREGQLYNSHELRRYFDLPQGEPDAIFSVCDTKTTGSDYCVAPIVYQYGNDFFIEDVLCENYAPDIVEANLVEIICKHNLHLAQFESNVAGGKLAADVQEKVKARGSRCKITTKWTQANKETKIIVNAPWVKQHCLFKDDTMIRGAENKEYRLMLAQLTQYTMYGKNKHDDVPDAFAQLAMFTQHSVTTKATIVKRPF